MGQKIINTRLQMRRDTAANWTSKNPTLLAGEMGVETDTHKFKFGDGSSTWTALSYAGADETQINTLIANAVDALDTSADINIASVSNNIVTIATGVKEENGLIKAGTGPSISLEEVAYTGAAADVRVAADATSGLTESTVQSTLQSFKTTLTKLDGANTVDGSIKKQIKDAVEALDVSDTAVANKFVTAVSETDGKISVSREALVAADIPTLAISKISGLQDALDGKQATITDGSATIASVTDNIVTLKAGVAQSGGAIANKSGTGNEDIKLAKVATTGVAADISITDANNKITATTVEGALAELATSISSVSSAGAVTCEKASASDAATAGVAARYTFKQGGTAIANAVIDIPKDMVISSGAVETKGEPGDDDAWPSAGTYLVLTLANATNDKVYINVGDLIEYVTSGSGESDMVKIAIDSDHKVTASVTDGSITLAKLASAVQTEIGKAHSHDNKSVLDGITSAKVTSWDTVVSTVGVATSTGVTGTGLTKRIEDLETSVGSTVTATVATLDYSDTAVAGKYVSAVSEADGVIAVTRANLPVTGVTDSATDNSYVSNVTLTDGVIGSTKVALPVIGVDDTAVTGSYVSAISLNSSTHKVEANHVALPTATASALGMVKFDNSTIKMNDNDQLYVASVSTDILAQGTDELVLNGGYADGFTQA